MRVSLKTHFPDVRIYARARNRYHSLRLMDFGVTYCVRDTLLSSLELCRELLQALGDSDAEAADSVSMFRRFDEELLKRQQAVQHDESRFIQSAKEAAEELQELFERQADERSS